MTTGARIVGSDGRAKAYRALPEPARREAREAGIVAYEEGHFWHAHELMEPAWMGSADRAERDLDQGLIKVAAAYVHAERGNLAGMRKNLMGARRLLAAVTGEHATAGRRAAGNAGVDAELLLRRVDDALSRVEKALQEREERGPSEGDAAPDPTRSRPDLLLRVPPPAIPRIGYSAMAGRRA